MNYLTFKQFIPSIFAKDKDFSKLVDVVKNTYCYRKNSNRFEEYSLIKGSIVSNYDFEVKKNHKNSDIDIVMVSDKFNYSMSQCKENLSPPFENVNISVDIININKNTLKKELDSFGEKGMITLNNLVQDSISINNPKLYSEHRYMALMSFLRLGLNYYEEDYKAVTPSGAMKAINQGRLMLNPLRWWSIQHAFKTSEMAEDNKYKYYKDVLNALDKFLIPIDKHDDEIAYKLPNNIKLKKNLNLMKIKYYAGRTIGKIHSNPILSINDIPKFKNKFKSLKNGIICDNKTDIDVLFQE